MEFFSARPTKTSIPVHVLRRSDVKKWLSKQRVQVKGWLKANGFAAKVGRIATFPAKDGSIGGAVVVRSDTPSPYSFARLHAELPKGRYLLEGELDEDVATTAALGWGLAGYEFTRYREARRKVSKLAWPKDARKKEVTRLLEATFLVRDLVNTPASDMGPAELAAVGTELAGRHGADIEITVGEELLEAGYPAVHAVGRASDRAPRLIDLRWGDEDAPKVTIVGKGVCFDSGGLDLKPASGMLLMKKDMGGGAHALALGGALMDAKLPIRLRVLVPAVENSVSGNAFRPMDVLQTRKGLTVEVGNTDAEGRLILCDALAEASTEEPELLVDFATLTGAARVALGTELPALFSNDDGWAQRILDAGQDAHDELWRMPLATRYDRHLKSNVADVNNVSSGRYGGAITAALFLRRFVDRKLAWVHVDQMAYNNDNRAGRPKGGEAMGLRAIYAAIASHFG